MDKMHVKRTESAPEKSKLYLTKKLSEIEIKLKRSKKKIIFQMIGNILIIGSIFH